MNARNAFPIYVQTPGEVNVRNAFPTERVPPHIRNALPTYARNALPGPPGTGSARPERVPPGTLRIILYYILSPFRNAFQPHVRNALPTWRGYGGSPRCI